MIYFINFLLALGFISSFASFMAPPEKFYGKIDYRHKLVYGGVAVTFVVLMIWVNLLIK